MGEELPAFDGKPRRAVELEAALPDVGDLLPLHDTRQAVTVVLPDGTRRAVSGTLRVYQTPGGSGGYLFVN